MPHVSAVYEDALQELRQRYPWPFDCPKRSFDGHGWFTDQNRRYLADNIDEFTNVIVELGSWLGLSSRFLLDTAPDATLICVDHWRGSDHPDCKAMKTEEVAKRIPTLFEQFLRNMWNYRERLIPVRAVTIDGMREIAALGIQPDLVYLDADHSYEGTRAEVDAILELFPHARLVGDDYSNFAGVKKAVDEVAAETGRVLKFDWNAWQLNP